MKIIILLLVLFQLSAYANPAIVEKSEDTTISTIHEVEGQLCTLIVNKTDTRSKVFFYISKNKSLNLFNIDDENEVTEKYGPFEIGTDRTSVYRGYSVKFKESAYKDNIQFYFTKNLGFLTDLTRAPSGDLHEKLMFANVEFKNIIEVFKVTADEEPGSALHIGTIRGCKDFTKTFFGVNENK